MLGCRSTSGSLASQEVWWKDCKKLGEVCSKVGQRFGRCMFSMVFFHVVFQFKDVERLRPYPGWFCWSNQQPLLATEGIP